jgi:hypothetical protein
MLKFVMIEVNTLGLSNVRHVHAGTLLGFVRLPAHENTLLRTTPALAH